jgi:hypothetical protein
MNETHQEGEREITRCPTCNEETKEVKENLTFYDVINIDVIQDVCPNGHQNTTEEELDRIAEVLKEKEGKIIYACIGKLLFFSIIGAAVFLFSTWAFLHILPAMISLICGMIVTMLYVGFVLTFGFKTFIAYYWAKKKSRDERRGNETDNCSSEDPLGALNEA